ncbi:MAG TPA: PAS domain S-box protein, partial [Pyrinomonadaceae bacterium]|nr:PAS domain S-box protein [Pyrinomonadaceae bacterium]
MNKSITPAIKVLLVDNCKNSYLETRHLFDQFRDKRYELEWTSSYKKALAAMKSNAHDVFLVDYRLGAKSGLDLLREAKRKGCCVPIILQTAQVEKQFDLEAMRAGAAEYLVKGQIDAPLLERAIRYALENSQTLQEIKNREKLYRTLAQNIPNTAVLLFDKDFRYTLAEGSQLERHGFSREMFEGKTLFEVFPTEISEKYSDYYRRALAGEIICFEQENTDRDLQIYFVPVRDENGEIFAGMAMWQDITERKRAERALVESEEQYRNLFENASDLIYIHDLEGRYISINQATERVFGYSREEVLGMKIPQVVAPENLEFARQKMAEKLAGEKQTVYELTCLTKDGHHVPLEINSCVIYKDGVPVAIQGI